jgi:hypothetical protein
MANFIFLQDLFLTDHLNNRNVIFLFLPDPSQIENYECTPLLKLKKEQWQERERKKKKIEKENYKWILENEKMSTNSERYANWGIFVLYRQLMKTF